VISYLELASDALNNGEQTDDRTGVGTRSVFGRQWRHDMRTGFPLLTTKRMPLRWCFEEARWMLSGSPWEQDLAKNGVDIWKEWATPEMCAKFGRPEGHLGPIYGPMMRAFPIGFTMADEDSTMPVQGATDQIKQLLWGIKNTPSSRRLLVTHWHPYYQSRVELPPCHTLWQCKVHQATKELSLHLYCRSIDLFLGLPFDIAFYGIMLHLIANCTDLTPRDLVLSFGDLHIYNNHVEAVQKQLKRKPHPLPHFLVKRKFTNPWDVTWEDCELSGYASWPKISAEVAI
jgi:thymidylate synthase